MNSNRAGVYMTISAIGLLYHSAIDDRVGMAIHMVILATCLIIIVKDN